MRSFFHICTLLCLFSQTVFAQKTPGSPASRQVVTGSILLNDQTQPDNKAILNALKSDWKVPADSVNIAGKTMVFTVPGATVMIAYLDYPVAPPELLAAAKISWLWPAATEEATRHKAQTVISIIGKPNKALDMYKLFTKVAAAVLENSRASGVFMNSQYLLLPKGFYTAAAHNMLQRETLPLYCWIYFGITQENGTSSGYTFGLEEFGLLDMEIVKATRSREEVHANLYDAVSQLLPYRTILIDGQAFTTSEGEKLSAKRSKGTYVEAETWKLGFVE